MAVPYVRQEPPASPELIARLEEHLGRALPADYRAYLLTQDGGRLDNNTGAVNTVFGLGEVPKWASMWRVLDMMPEWLLPVANDEYGNLYAISLRPEGFGSVWFGIMRRRRTRGSRRARRVSLLRDGSWAGLVEGLQPLQKAAARPERILLMRRRPLPRKAMSATIWRRYSSAAL